METIDFILLVEEEMFGLQVNDYEKVQEGQYGYGVKLNIAEYKPRRLDFVQGSTQPLSISAPVTQGLTLATIQALPDDENLDDLSWYWRDETLHIVFNETVYDYTDDDCRFAFGGIRFPMIATQDTDYVDISDRHLSFLVAKARQIAWNLKKKMVDKDIEAEVRKLTQKIEISA